MAQRLSKNFWSYEFSCSCGCNSGRMDPALIVILQKLRDALGEPLRVTSGIRCEEHNKTVSGAARRSWHIPRDEVCHAADIAYSTGSKPPSAIMKMYILADQYRVKGLGLYHNRIHVDTRPGRIARWMDESWNWRNV